MVNVNFEKFEVAMLLYAARLFRHVIELSEDGGYPSYVLTDNDKSLLKVVGSDDILKTLETTINKIEKASGLTISR